MPPNGDQTDQSVGIWEQVDDGLFLKLSPPDGGGVRLLMVQVLTLSVMRSLDNQITNTNSLFLPLGAKAPINAQLDVCINSPVSGSEFWFEGRAVMSAPSGTGLEVKTLDDNFALRWKAAIESFVPGMRAPAELRDFPRTSSPRTRQGSETRRKSPRRRFLKRGGATSSSSANARHQAPESKHDAPTRPGAVSVAKVPSGSRPRQAPSQSPEESPRSSKGRWPSGSRLARSGGVSSSTSVQPASSPSTNSSHRTSRPESKPEIPKPKEISRPSSSRGRRLQSNAAEEARPVSGTRPTRRISPGAPQLTRPSTPTSHAAAPPPPPKPLPPRSSGQKPPKGLALPEGKLETRALTAFVAKHPPTLTHDSPRGLEGWLMDVVALDSPGLLVLKGRQCTCTFILKGGYVLEVFVEPSQPSWDLGLLLTSAGVMSEAQRRELNELARAHGIKSHEALVHLDLLEGRQLSMALQSRIVYVLTKIFELPIDGAAFIGVARISQRFSARAVPLIKTIFVNHLEALAKLDEEALDLELEGRTQHRVTLVTPPPLPAETLALDKDRARFYDKHLDTTRQFRDLLHLSNLPSVETKALLLALEAFRFIRMEKDREASTRAVMARVSRMAERIGDVTHYELLDLHWSAYPALIKETIEAKKEAFDPQKIPPALLSKVRDDVDAIQAALDEVWALLKDRHAREAYRKTFLDPQQIENAIHIYYRHGDTAIFRRDIKAARPPLLRVLELDPRNTEARKKLNLLDKGVFDDSG